MTVFEDFATQDTAQATSAPDIATWYQTFKNPDVNKTEEPIKEKRAVAKINPALSDLMLYAFQVKAYSEFIMNFANSVSEDVQRDIRMDNTIPIVPVLPEGAQPPVEPEPPRPLTFAVKNREGLITAAANINELAQAMDSILSRVKGIK